MTLLFGSEKGIIFSDVIDSMILIISFSGGYMEKWEIEVKEHWNKISDSEWYQSLRTDDRLSELYNNPETAFHPEMLSLMKKYIGNFTGKRILLPSSGDNHAAFAFALMGAKVTSADISERQLENAKSISDSWGLNIEYVCDNTMYLSKIDAAAYDLVYTSNGTLTWIGDLNEMYRNISRVLRDGGYSAMYDMHPFTRPFTMEAWKEPTVRKSYHDVFPDLHWKVQDIINSNVSAGLNIIEMAEMSALDASFWYTYDELKSLKSEEYATINDWKCNPMAAIPAWIGIVSQK